MRFFLVFILIFSLLFSCSMSDSSEGGGGTKNVILNINDIPLGAEGNTIWIYIFEETTPGVSVERLAYETTVDGTDMSFTIANGATSDTAYGFSSDSIYLIDLKIDLDGDGILDALDYGDFVSYDNTLNAPDTTMNIDVTDVGGTLTLSFTNSTDINGHSVYFTIYDSNETDSITGAPTGTVLGQVIVAISGGTGSATVVTMDQSADAVFANRTFYIGGLIDMNDNILSTMTADSGDRYGSYIEFTIADADLTVNLTSANFPNPVP